MGPLGHRSGKETCDCVEALPYVRPTAPSDRAKAAAITAPTVVLMAARVVLDTPAGGVSLLSLARRRCWLDWVCPAGFQAEPGWHACPDTCSFGGGVGILSGIVWWWGGGVPVA